MRSQKPRASSGLFRAIRSYGLILNRKTCCGDDSQMVRYGDYHGLLEIQLDASKNLAVGRTALLEFSPP